MTDAPERIWIDACGGKWSPVSGGTQREEYIRADLVTQRTPDPAVLALVEALRFGVDLIEGDSFGAEWKRGQSDFRKMARAALAAFDKTD